MHLLCPHEAEALQARAPGGKALPIRPSTDRGSSRNVVDSDALRSGRRRRRRKGAKRDMGGEADERARRIEAIAEEALEMFGAGRQVEPFAIRYPGFDLGEAYAVAARVRD